MRNRFFKIFAFLFITFLSTLATAQSNIPFSRFGAGDLAPSVFTAQQGMGNIAAGLRTPYHINFTNPASYAGFYEEVYRSFYVKIRRDSTITDANGKTSVISVVDSVRKDTISYIVKATSFETAIGGYNYNVRNISDEVRSGDATLNYLALGFPLPKIGGFSIGLMPYSNVQYNILKNESVINNDDTLSRTSRHIGEGGLFQVYSGVGVKIKNFSIGVNGMYMFGTMDLRNIIYYPGISSSLGTRELISNNVRGFTWNAGIQYKHYFSREMKNSSNGISLTLGAYGKPSTTLTAKEDLIYDRVIVVNDDLFQHLDSTLAILDSERRLHLPAEIGVGFVLERSNFDQKNDWLIGVDFNYQMWSKHKAFLFQSDQNDSWRISAGLQYQPDLGGNFLARNKYRTGIIYSQSNIIVNSNPVNEYGITFGLGIPVRMPRDLSSGVDLAVQFGKEGSVQDNLISQSYFRFSLGFNLNTNSWIYRSKFY